MVELFDPHSKEWLLKKFEIYDSLRSNDVAYWSEKYQMYVLTKYADVLFALKNPDIFSSAKGNLIVEMPHRFGSTLGASDDPRHSFYKNIVKNAYGKSRLEEIGKNAKLRIAQEFDRVKGKPIHISSMIERISACVTADILGLPANKSYIEELIANIQKKSSKAVMHNTDDTSYDEFVKVVKDAVETNTTPTYEGIYKEYLENNPKRYPIYSLFTGPTLSGASSLTGALEFLTLDLFREQQLEYLLKDKSLINNAVNESIRFHASTGRFSRTVAKETELHGIKLMPDTRVAVCLESANRDPEKFSNANLFDLNRDTSGNLGFGYGAHACIALAISKEIMTIYLEVLLEKIGNYKIASTDYNYVITQSGNDDMIDNLILEKI